MRRRNLFSLLGAAAALPVLILSAAAQALVGVPAARPDASLDLASAEGVRLVRGEWRYSDTRIVEAEFRAAGPDGQPTGAPVKTYDYEPHAGRADFDDSRWEVVEPAALSERRGHGRLWFNWYRLRLTVPERVGDFETAGSTLVFETALDDYAEVWVDGELARSLGQSGGSVVSGWNAPNRLVVGRGVRPGQQIQLAVFGINGPLSNPPTNFIWVRHARLDFYRGGAAVPLALVPSEVNVEVVRRDPLMERITGPNPKIFKLAEGFRFTEGPVWVGREGGYLLFSDPNSNRIYKYRPGGAAEPGGLTVFREPSGYAGADIKEYGQPGSNGLALDPRGRLTINQHGNRRVVRLEEGGGETVLAERFEGRRLNSPNDLVYAADGTLFFTDPPFGLPKFSADPRKELPFSGVYSLREGRLRLLTKELEGPNGIALSPDEKHLYVGNWDERRVVVMRYEVNPDATVGRGEVFFDMTPALDREKNAIDGIKVDAEGNLYVAGPGGLWVISPAGRHLGTIIAPKHIHNMAWGDDDRKTLYLCARSGLYRMRFNVAGTN
ncbi:MAG TPA: SMP-30/gluconolactonase/LRE family protein [Pyrinomonadaceae bacterium]|nr:SMP-30/gluconolactonase/LRE family protein [Pyrinomonadaceae bacterium]